jgi:hypothetical protein
VRRALEQDDLTTARKALEAVSADEPEVNRLKILLAPPRVTVSHTHDVDRSREYQWFRDHWAAYRGDWVAVEGDNLLARARSLRELRDALRMLNPARPPLVHRID